MRLAVLLLIAACDLQPPKPKREAPPPTLAVPADAGAAVAKPPTEKECTDVAAHIAQQVIAAVPEAERPPFEQDRTKLVLRASETCMRDAWSEAARQCFFAASTKEQLEKCGKDLKAP